MVEVAHKEIRRYVLLKYAEYEDDFDLKNTLIDAINTHNHNIHTTIGFKPIDIINNSDEEMMKKYMN